VGFLLAKVFARGRYHIFAGQDYESRIRGGHNFFPVRVKASRVGAIAEPVDMLVALSKESIDLHREELGTGGVVILDGERIRDISADSRLFGIPLERLAEEKAGDRVMTNTVALGAALALVGYDVDTLNSAPVSQWLGTMGKAGHLSKPEYAATLETLEAEIEQR
jgi:2-oxoglutarate ferredoxin oxidoreductase subunit alpha